MSDKFFQDTQTIWNNIDPVKKLAYIHIPRNGGTSISRSLGLKFPSTNKPYSEFLRIVPNTSEYYFFTFVRNPWDRLVSFYRNARLDRSMHIRSDTPSNALIGKHMHYDLFSKITFRQMVYLLTEGRLVPFDNSMDCMQPQYYWIQQERPTRPIDFIGKLENIKNDLSSICARLGIPPVQLSRENSSGERVDYRLYYDIETRDLIAKYYNEDIARFDYTF